MAQPNQEPPSAVSSSPSKPDWRDAPVKHYLTIGVAVLSPLALALPPRRLDLRAFLLTAAMWWSVDELAYDYTGASMTQRTARRIDNLLKASELPEPARRNKILMEAERARREAAARNMTVEELQRSREGSRESTVLSQLTGDEKWKMERAKKEQEALDSGRGILGLITDQIWEVWNQESDKKAVTETKGKMDDPSDGDSKDAKKPE